MTTDPASLNPLLRELAELLPSQFTPRPRKLRMLHPDERFGAGGPQQSWPLSVRERALMRDAITSGAYDALDDGAWVELLEELDND